MKTALITGMNGFVGSFVALNLVSKGVKVIGVDLATVPHNKALAELIENGTVTVYKGDLNSFDFDSLPPCDYVYQIAGKVSPWGKVENFDHINVDGTKRVMDYAIKVKAKGFLYLSSVAVYGYGGYIDLPEDAEKIPFNNPYGISKLHAETMVMQYAKENNLPFVVIRPGNVYGPYDYTSSNHLYKLISKEKMAYMSKGKYVSCFVYVENLAEAIATSLLTEKARNEDYNITDGVGETLHEYFAAVAKEMGVRPKFMSLPAWMGKGTAGLLEFIYKLIGSKKGPLLTKFSAYQNCVDYHFSIEKSKEKFGFVPQVSMEEGIKRTVKWFNTVKEQL